ncbi:DUF309 domain-containing protein [Metabacillus sp. GX 13764]|uniref:DUF309 domain-containing protein n=1 Tax=Metabacillus kandeliae TaxID=2900151 RepID=UPI001E488477|nr:DUF309 domain-containing protein [Metabacillus kandeliae]MCD7036230.1 DUF309 domain-containing protein [Metabacillus kandeliae]
MKEYPAEYYQFFVSFNEGDYYTCHDLLEDIWLTDKENLFLKGLLQMSVAIYHYEYGNVKGARLMMLAGKQYIQPYRPFYWGIDLERVHVFMEKCLSIIPHEIDKVPYELANELPSFPSLFLYLDDRKEKHFEEE